MVSELSELTLSLWTVTTAFKMEAALTMWNRAFVVCGHRDFCIICHRNIASSMLVDTLSHSAYTLV